MKNAKLSIYQTFSGFLSCILLILSIPVNILSQDFKTVHDGLEYAEVTREISGLKVNMNLLRLDLAKVRIDVVHAMDEAIGVEKTSSIASRHGALAAINAGFFRLDNSLYAGDAAGALTIDHIDYSESYADRIALFIMNDPKKMGPDKTGVYIRPFDSRFVVLFGEDQIDLSGLNRERKENELILYRPQFHSTTLTDPNGVEVVVRNNRVERILDGRGSTAIPADGFILSATGTARPGLLKYARIGAKVQVLGAISQSFSSDDPDEGTPVRLRPSLYGLAEDIVAGVPQLIKNGKIKITWEEEKSTKAFVETRHPRTAVAKLKDGKFLMITVDGRSEISGGIGLQDLAEYLLSLGAVDAMNLDGGGSTTMFVDGKVVNHPSDKEGERKVSDALLVRKR
jgi:hypothetical protein